MLVAVLTVVLVALATYRITRLLVRDSFPPIAVQRARIEERWGDGSWQAYLSTCTWCASVYVGGVVIGITDYITSVPLPGWTWAAASAVAGLLASWEQVEVEE